MAGVFLACVPWTAHAAATVGEARISVFRQGSSTTRSVGSLVGVWHWTGRTYANQHQNAWQRPLPSQAGNTDVMGCGIWRQGPSFAIATSESAFLRFTGTTWLSDALQNVAHSNRHTVSVFNSSFAVVGHENEDFWRWTGTSWLHDFDGPQNSLPRTIDILATDFAFAFADNANTTAAHRAVYHWRGTSWQVHLTQSSGALGNGGMVATDYGWYFGRPSSNGFPNVYRWAGTSWLVHAQLDSWGANAVNVFLTIPGERDFAVTAGANGIIWRWTGTSWLDERGVTSQPLVAGVAVQTDWVWLTGGSGTVLRWTGTSWVRQGPLTGDAFRNIDATATDFAVLTGLSGHLWFWRGTSWVRDPTSEVGTGNLRACATAGPTFTVASGVNNLLVARQRVNLIDDAAGSGGSWTGTLYRTVVQLSPTDGTWNWESDGVEESYFGVVNRDGNTCQFLDEGDSDTAGRQIVLDRALDDTSIEDIFIWEDTVGNWDGHSESPHNRNAGSGIKLTQGGTVRTNAGTDVWGEMGEYHLDGGSGTTWETAAGDTAVTVGEDLVWEFWHLADAGFSQGDLIDTGIHVKRDAGDPSSDTIEGIRWEYRVGHYTPRTGNWRWCKDDAADPTIIKEPGGRLTDISPNGERLRLRVRIDETNGGWMPSATGDSGWTLWYSTDQVNWTQLTTSSSVWMLYNGQGGAGNTVGEATLPGVDTLGIKVERNSAQNGFKQEPFTEVEMDYSIQSTAASSGTIYYFEARNNGHRALPKPGVRYPSVRTTDDTAHNYVYTRPELGRFSRPMVNPALAAGGNGDPFKVVYVATQGGSGDQLFAISRTNGGLVRSFSASGTLEHGNLYWDSTNARYNLFFRQGNSSILALKDDGGTITTNASWASNPLSFTNLIGRPVRFFDEDKQNYMMLLVTSFQGNSSTIYKVRGSDGTIMTDGEYSKNSPGGWAQGLRTTASMYPLWVTGTTFALAEVAASHIVKIPNMGGATSTNFGVTIQGVANFSPTYTRTTITTGGRIMAIQQGYTEGMTIASDTETVTRINDANMEGVEWNGLGVPGFSADLSNTDSIDTPAFSPPFQSAFPVPVYVGDSTPSAQINRLSGSTGENENNYPYNLTGSVSTEILIKGNWIYFGTSSGYIYALSATDPDAPGGANAFRVPSGASVTGVAIDSTNSLVYYTTQDGRIYQFDTR